MKDYDLIILGGGIIGLSVAREKALSDPDCNILIIEKEQKINKTNFNLAILIKHTFPLAILIY